MNSPPKTPGIAPAVRTDDGAGFAHDALVLPQRTPRPRAAFTLVELLVVIAIIGILAGILIPVTATVRGKARQSACVSNLRQIGTAFHLYLADNKGKFPPFESPDGGEMYNFGGEPRAWGGPPKKNRPLYPYLPDMKIYRCLGDRGGSGRTDKAFFEIAGNSYLVANSRSRGVLPSDQPGKWFPGIYEALEAPSRTILVVEQNLRDFHDKKDSGLEWHPGGVTNVLMADTHVVPFTKQTALQYEISANPPPPGYTWGWKSGTGELQPVGIQ
ncbi:prepilin-type N-terminal cleavage/methylation domain-containing protein [Opitutaceae bacterium TAV1]|nr:prepilin-type N-terminal cleavage/methylation domain-containing protein [Opitutaceae bacterium TAV1]